MAHLLSILVSVALTVVLGLLLVVPAIVILWLAYGFVLQLLIWLTWLPRGRDLLVIYSDSPHWKDYFEQEFLPKFDNRAVVLNWSQRKQWRRWSLPVRAFYFFGGARDYNPLLIVFRPLKWVKVVRLHRPFRESRHGKQESLNAALSTVESML